MGPFFATIRFSLATKALVNDGRNFCATKCRGLSSFQGLFLLGITNCNNSKKKLGENYGFYGFPLTSRKRKDLPPWKDFLI
jgi:hypothetical protein